MFYFLRKNATKKLVLPRDIINFDQAALSKKYAGLVVYYPIWVLDCPQSRDNLSIC